jgi:hypothetical protein
MVSSERPFGSPALRPLSGCVGRDHVAAFDFPTGRFLGVIAELPMLNGQAVLILP